MFAVEIPGLYFYGRLPKVRKAMSARTREQSIEVASPQERVRAALAAMLPSTAEEIAEASGLDPVTAAALLDEMAARCRVMFNPLTKRYSLPKRPLRTAVAA